MAPRKNTSQGSRTAPAKPRAAAAGTKPAKTTAGRSPKRAAAPRRPAASSVRSRKPQHRALPRVIPVERAERNREAAPQGSVAATAEPRSTAGETRPPSRPATAPSDREGATFVQLLPRDAESFLVFWQTSRQTIAALLGEVGERTLALSRPTLRLTDERGLRPEFVLLPEDTRSCSLRVDPRRLAYRAEFGYTLPSGEFRRLAESPTVRPPKAAAPGRVATAAARFGAVRRPTFEESRRHIEQAIRAGDWARAHAIADTAGIDVVAVLDRRSSVSSDATVRGGASEQHH